MLMKRLLYLSFALTTWYTTPVYGSDQRPNRIARKRSIKYDEATQAAIINNINTTQDNKEKILSKYNYNQNTLPKNIVSGLMG